MFGLLKKYQELKQVRTIAAEYKQHATRLGLWHSGLFNYDPRVDVKKKKDGSYELAVAVADMDISPEARAFLSRPKYNGVDVTARTNKPCCY